MKRINNFSTLFRSSWTTQFLPFPLSWVLYSVKEENQSTLPIDQQSESHVIEHNRQWIIVVKYRDSG